MINKIFNNTAYLEKGLDAAWLRNQVISNNIANVDTPGFKSSKVEFESIFKSALEGSLKGDNAQEMAALDDLGEVNPRVIQNNNTSMRMDGNNVDIDYEMSELAKNTIYYNTLIQKLNSEFDRLRLAIREGK